MQQLTCGNGPAIGSSLSSSRRQQQAASSTAPTGSHGGPVSTGRPLHGREVSCSSSCTLGSHVSAGRKLKLFRTFASAAEAGIEGEIVQPLPPYSGPFAERLVVQVGGREVVIETGEVARQAGGAVMAREGDTVLLTTACCSDDPTGDGSFLPLQVNYFERFSAAGRTSGGFNKRASRQGMGEVLVSRLVDRPLRPLFAKGWANETQVLSWVMSYDGVHPTEPLAITAASAALLVSDIPFTKPVAGVRVGFCPSASDPEKYEYVINPTLQQMDVSRLDLVLAGSSDAVLMIEGFCDFLTEEQMLEAIAVGHEAIKGVCQALGNWAAKVGKPKRDDVIKPPQGLDAQLQELVGTRIEDIYRSVPSKQDRAAALGGLKEEVVSQLMATITAAAAAAESNWQAAAQPEITELDVSMAWKRVESGTMRHLVLSQGFRADGRGVSEVRPISSRAGVLPRTHGSALFTRGETQALAVTTLGGADAAQRMDSLTASEDETQRFILQYYFPPCSVGETGRVGAPGRREVGHGNLAERALLPAVPDEKQFPYIMRVESTITESNGSSSMATVCGGCLSMLDAGIPVKTMVAGVAMGLVLEPDGSFVTLTDILGSEDALGDMDFKVAGSEDAITAFQMDIKVEGITLAIMEQALLEAKAARVHILNQMRLCNPPPASRLSQYAPRIMRFNVPPEKVGTVIGSGGRTIKGLCEATSSTIQINDTGCVEVIGTDDNSMAKAKELVIELVTDATVGTVYRGVEVFQVAPYGVLVKTKSGKTGLVHVSELDVEYIASVAEKFKEGDVLDVQVIEVQDNGNMRLSRKALMIADAAARGEILVPTNVKPSGNGDGSGGSSEGGAPSRRNSRPGPQRPGTPGREGGDRPAYQKRSSGSSSPRGPGTPRPSSSASSTSAE